jgi:hypothetical protein
VTPGETGPVHRGVEERLPRRAHNPEIVGSSPTAATRIPVAAFIDSGAAIRLAADSDRPIVHSGACEAQICRLRNVVLNGGQPGQSDAHRLDAGGNQANRGAPGSRVESPAQVMPAWAGTATRLQSAGRPPEYRTRRGWLRNLDVLALPVSKRKQQRATTSGVSRDGRGSLDSVAEREFGRKPLGNLFGGRDHDSCCWSKPVRLRRAGINTTTTQKSTVIIRADLMGQSQIQVRPGAHDIPTTTTNAPKPVAPSSSAIEGVAQAEGAKGVEVAPDSKPEHLCGGSPRRDHSGFARRAPGRRGQAAWAWGSGRTTKELSHEG